MMYVKSLKPEGSFNIPVLKGEGFSVLTSNFSLTHVCKVWFCKTSLEACPGLGCNLQKCGGGTWAFSAHIDTQKRLKSTMFAYS